MSKNKQTHICKWCKAETWQSDDECYAKPISSVEWLTIQLWEEMNMQGDGAVFNKLLEQAKAMHKQEIMNAWYNGFEENRPYVDHSEDYYNETFGGNNEQQ